MPEITYTHLTVRVDHARVRRVQRLAARRGITVSELVRALLDQALLADDEERGVHAHAAG